MAEPLILPLSSTPLQGSYSTADEECEALVSAWIHSRVAFIREIWSSSSKVRNTDLFSEVSDLADEILTILTHRVFNFQSKKNLTHILPAVRQNLSRQLSKGTPIRLFLLYNGGYRASSFPQHLSLIFNPDQTELMLLYQIALLDQKITAVYEPGIEFFIVINNGVAQWVNDIPLADTENYVKQFRALIERMGGEHRVRILVQSELDGYEPGFSFDPFQPEPLLSEKEHNIVERFLGRACSREEAARRSALYKLAESKWAEDLLPFVTEKDGLILRQVAHPGMLSFRPFPGGAIRVQNGSLGFQYEKNTLKPKLITSQSVQENGVQWVPYPFPWSVKKGGLA